MVHIAVARCTLSIMFNPARAALPYDLQEVDFRVTL